MALTVTLPKAAELLLDDPKVQALWEADISTLGGRISKRALLVVGIVTITILVAVICGIVAFRTNSHYFWLGSLAALTVAFSTTAIWRQAPYRDVWKPLLGRAVIAPDRLEVFRQALASGKCESKASDGRVAESSLFDGALWPLNFARHKLHRHHVRAADGSREPNLLMIDCSAFDAWRRDCGWLTTSAENRPLQSVDSTAQPVSKQNKKSLWILEMKHTQITLDRRLHALIPNDSDLARQMARTAMSAALGHIIVNGEKSRVVDAIADAEKALLKQYGHTGKTRGTDSIKWIEAMLSAPPRWLKFGLAENPNQHRLPLQ